MRQWVLRSLMSLLVLISAIGFAQDTVPANDENASFAALADVIENPEQREKLVATLRTLSESDATTVAKSTDEANADADTDASMASSASAASESESADEDESTEDEQDSANEEDAIKTVAEGTKAAVVSAVSLPGKLAAQTNEIAVEVGESLLSTWDSMVNIVKGKDYRLKNLNKEAFLKALLNLAFVIVIVIALFQGARYVTRPLKRRLNVWSLKNPRYKPIVRNIIAAFTVALVDAIFLGLTYLIANSIAIYGIGEVGSLSVQSSLFLNAFLIIEAIKIALRLVFYHRYAGLRLLPGKDATARYWYNWLANMVNIIGYGYMVAVPLVNANMSYALGKTLSSVLAIVAFIYGVTVVWRNRRNVSGVLNRMAEQNKTIILSTFLRTLAHTWHWLAIAYFIMLLVVTILQAERALPFVMHGTMWTIISIGLGILLSTLLTQLIGHRIVISAELRRKLPYLEARLNSYVPIFLRLIRFVLSVTVILVVLSAWDVIDLDGWIRSEKGVTLLSRWLGIFMIVLVAFLVWLFISSIIEHRLSAETGSGRPTARAQTLLSLFKNALTITIAAVTVMMVLSEIGINIGPLIAGAGVLGLAIGFGAQTLVQDVITGVFIQIENAVNAGDLVTLSGITGTVEHISIRSVGLRDLSGTYHLIPFSSVSTVSNFNRGYAFHLEEYGIAYREDIDEAIAVIEDAFKELSEGEHKRAILEPININGVTKLDNSSVNIRVSIKTIAGEQFAVGRAFNRLVKIYFDRAGIEMPFPHMTMYFGQGKQGEAPPANLRLMREPFDIDGQPQQVKSVTHAPTDNALDSDSHEDSGRGQTHTHDPAQGKDSGQQSDQQSNIALAKAKEVNPSSFGDTSEIRVAPRRRKPNYSDMPNDDGDE